MAAGQHQLDARVEIEVYRLAVVGDGGNAPLLDVIKRQQRSRRRINEQRIAFLNTRGCPRGEGTFTAFPQILGMPFRGG
ncbi:MAG: hypothetical protein D8H94_09850 [Cardiobacterium sp.]|nr:MAG: hypothetical protein D8H94_09850 [Cardiobacterium sp.]